MSYRVVPSSASAGSTSTGSSSSSHPQFSGVHDSLRAGGPRSLSAELSAPQHPLQNRLAEWDDTRDSLKFNVQRTAFGMHMPIRQAMERQLVSFDPTFPGLGQSNNVHLDILQGKDESLDVSDVLVSARDEAVGSGALSAEFHTVMEKKHHI